MGEFYRVNILGASSALLPLLAFDGASKRNKPNLRTGALVFCRMSLADRVRNWNECLEWGHCKADFLFFSSPTPLHLLTLTNMYPNV